jgi:hypothetical protein
MIAFFVAIPCERTPGREVTEQVSGDGRRKRLLREQIGQVIRIRTAKFINLPR